MKIFAALRISRILCQINLSLYFDAVQKLKDQSKCFRDLMVSNKYSLTEGILSIETDVLYNQRFFGPFTKRSFQNPEQTIDADWFVADKIKDGGIFISKNTKNQSLNEEMKNNYSINLASTICKLFPSLGLHGLGIFLNSDSNFGRILKCLKTASEDSRQDLLILAKLLFCCSNKNERVLGKTFEVKN